ncbi:MAG: TIGR02757 family protein [Bacteroidales bacterium]|nr:TIGR02757 family protein [Bacteroidales bacterium]
MLTDKELYEFLEEKVSRYNQPSFIETDPVSIPHGFSGKEDIEISAFLTSAISWGNRKSILSGARKLMNLLDNSPLDFITGSTDKEVERFAGYVYRTFNGDDCSYFIRSLKGIYAQYGSLEPVFAKPLTAGITMKESILSFRELFLSMGPLPRTRKHVPDPAKNSAAKRINMFLRWMVRKDNRGVDFGIWKSIPASALYCPLDIHTGNTARRLKLLARKQNDWKAVEELTSRLRRFDPEDPVKYDFALFGLGIHEKF